MRHGQKRQNRGRKIWLTLGMIVVVLFIAIGMAAHNHSPKIANNASTATSKAKPRKVANSTAASSNQQGKAVILSDLSQKAAQESNAGNGQAPTYSRFYFNNQDQKWYWQLSSPTKGVVENAEVKAATKTQNGYNLQLAADKSNPTSSYQMNIRWLDPKHSSYHLQSSLNNLNANYSLNGSSDKKSTNSSAAKNSSSDSSSSTLSTSQIQSWVWQHLQSKYAGQGFTINDFGWQISKNANGGYTVVVRENHRSADMEAKGADPNTAPIAGIYQINSQGQLIGQNETRTANQVIAQSYGQ